MTNNVLPYELSGNKNSNQILIFLHGWPDTSAIWDKVIPSFEKNYYILNITYPNYSQKEQIPKGQDFEVIADRVKATIDHVNETKRKVVVVSHDWGCFVGYFLDHRNPGYISEMIALDVGGKFNLMKPMILFYQLSVLIAFIIGGSIGRFITQWILKYFKYWPAWAYRMDGSWNFSYYYLWKKIILAGFSSDKGFLPNYKPSCPIAFVWGTLKSDQYFKQSWLDLLAENPKSEVHAVSAHHWIQTEQPDFLVNLIQRKLTSLS